MGMPIMSCSEYRPALNDKLTERSHYLRAGALASCSVGFTRVPRKRSPLLVPSERPGAPGGARDTNRQKKAGAITSAATALFLARGIESVSIDEITRDAGVAKGSFYRYFDDKTALVEHLFAHARAEIEAAFARCERALA